MSVVSVTNMRYGDMVICILRNQTLPTPSAFFRTQFLNGPELAIWPKGGIQKREGGHEGPWGSMEVLQSPREVARSSRKAFQCPSSPSSSCLPSSLYRKAERLLGSDEACELDLKKKNEKWDKLCPVPFQSNLSGSSPGCTSEPSLRILKYLDRWQTAKLIKHCQRH